MTDWLACSRVADGPGAFGSRRSRCSACGSYVWVAPSSRRLIAERGLTIVCIQCAAERAQTNPPEEIKPPTAEQIAELIAWQRRN